MERNAIKKFVYEDNGVTKVVKGRILEEDEFTFKIIAESSNVEIILGKRAIVKVYSGGA